jgi:hypothetical protein
MFSQPFPPSSTKGSSIGFRFSMAKGIKCLKSHVDLSPLFSPTRPLPPSSELNLLFFRIGLRTLVLPPCHLETESRLCMLKYDKAAADKRTAGYKRTDHIRYSSRMFPAPSGELAVRFPRLGILVVDLDDPCSAIHAPRP